MQGELTEDLIYVNGTSFSLNQLNYENPIAIDALRSAGIFVSRRASEGLFYPQTEQLGRLNLGCGFRPVLTIMLPVAAQLESFEILGMALIANKIFSNFQLSSAATHPNFKMVVGVDTLVLAKRVDGWHACRYTQAITNNFVMPRVNWESLCRAYTPLQETETARKEGQCN